MAEDFLRNVWYAAAWEEEIVGDSLLARQLLGEPRVLYRRGDGGGYALLLDRCPHRFAPLSLGRRHGDTIACRYHGLEFGPDGHCVRNPFSDHRPKGDCVGHLPTQARHGLVWFWPGDPAAADPALIPDFAFLDGLDVWRRHSEFAGDSELLTDNLLDLSHVDYLHRDTFATNGTHSESEQKVFDGEGHTLWTTWRIPRVKRFPVLDAHFAADEVIDQLLELRWDPPASMMLRISWLPAGADEASARVRMPTPHIITPEGRGRSHYFWSCEPNEDSERFARAVFDGEDKPMIEAVQQRMAGRDFWDLTPLVIAGDRAAVRVRRRLQKLRRAEAQAPGIDNPGK